MLALLAFVLVVAAGGAWLLLPHGARTAPANPTPQPLPALPPPRPALPPPAPAPTIEVIVDSTPTGAKIVRDGVAVGETPEALALAGPVTVVLRKDSFADKTVVVDPAATRKLVVKLERVHASAPKPPAHPPSKVAVAASNAATPKPAATATATATRTRPAAPPPAHDDLAARVEKQGAAAVSGGHRVGALYRGAAAEEGGRSDWFVPLEGGHCFIFVGEGGAGVNKLYLYLWGPGGRRLQSTREDTPHARMGYCTAFPGTYHVQAKVDDGQGEYRLGVYSK
jgi:hypothetical protein